MAISHVRSIKTPIIEYPRKTSLKNARSRSHGFDSLDSAKAYVSNVISPRRAAGTSTAILHKCREVKVGVGCRIWPERESLAARHQGRHPILPAKPHPQQKVSVEKGQAVCGIDDSIATLNPNNSRVDDKRKKILKILPEVSSAQKEVLMVKIHAGIAICLPFRLSKRMLQLPEPLTQSASSTHALFS